MRIKELKKILSEIDSDYDECEVCVYEPCARIGLAKPKWVEND